MIKRIVLLICLFVSSHVLAQRTAHYQVESRQEKKSVVLPPETWKTSLVDDGAAIEVDKGNDNVEIHDIWQTVSPHEAGTHLVERYWIHPTEAFKQRLVSFIGFVKKVNLEGEVLEAWPAFHSLQAYEGALRLTSTYFPPNQPKVVWKRIYGTRTYFLPYMLIKETYANVLDETPTETLVYRRTKID